MGAGEFTMKCVVAFLVAFLDLGITIERSVPSAAKCKHELPPGGPPWITMGTKVAELCNYLLDGRAKRDGSRRTRAIRETLWYIVQATRRWLLQALHRVQSARAWSTR